MSIPENVFVETVTERFDGCVISSTVRRATEEDVVEARKLHEEGKCPHNVVVDSYGWMYDTRDCYVCGAGLGMV